jgi:hypothetical protein
MDAPRFILEINTRVWLRELGSGMPLTLDDVSDEIIVQWAENGFDAVWLMGIWLPSEDSRRIALEHSGLIPEYSAALPDWTAEDVLGSPYAIAGYQINPDLGGGNALADFRARLAARKLKLILDFVPNHTACDHPWITEHPEWYILGTEADVVANPDRWFWVKTAEGLRAVAHGRDPYFAPWTDTAQLNYYNPDLQAAMRAELLKLAACCDGVRCDMAMLEISSVVQQVWNRYPEEFWPRAIQDTKKRNPDFCFIAEVYWGLEDTLRKMGFDLTYDKELLDLVVAGQPLKAKWFEAPPSEQSHLLRFLENHDEPRIASRLDGQRLNAAATWVYSLPGSRLVYEGQFDGKRVRLPVQLARGPQEPFNPILHERYEALFAVLKRDIVRRGTWKSLHPVTAWSGNSSHERILGQGYDLDNEHLRIFVNWSDSRSQCYVHLELGSLTGQEIVLTDLTGPKSYVRDGMELMMRGLYLDLEPWEVHVFDCAIRPVE